MDISFFHNFSTFDDCLLIEGGILQLFTGTGHEKSLNLFVTLAENDKILLVDSSISDEQDFEAGKFSQGEELLHFGNQQYLRQSIKFCVYYLVVLVQQYLFHYCFSRHHEQELSI